MSAQLEGQLELFDANPPQAITVHCVWCKHTETYIDGMSASNAMERHYWDRHYTDKDRAALREAGQSPERIGTK